MALGTNATGRKRRPYYYYRKVSIRPI